MFCKVCKKSPPEVEFYKAWRTRCVECCKAAAKANRMDNLERYKKADALRANQPERIAMRERYRATPNGKEAIRRAHKVHAERHPLRRGANVALGNAVKGGRVIPWPVCAVPSCCGKPEGHHPDYSQPLSVVWLCSEHHKQVHREL